MEVMKKAFRAKGKLTARDWGVGLIIFSFAVASDMDWVVQNQPWHFDNSLFVVSPLSGVEQPSSLSLSHASFWARVYDIPVAFQNETVLRSIGHFVKSCGVFDRDVVSDHGGLEYGVEFKAPPLRRPRDWTPEFVFLHGDATVPPSENQVGHVPTTSMHSTSLASNPYDVSTPSPPPYSHDSLTISKPQPLIPEPHPPVLSESHPPITIYAYNPTFSLHISSHIPSEVHARVPFNPNTSHIRGPQTPILNPHVLHPGVATISIPHVFETLLSQLLSPITLSGGQPVPQTLVSSTPTISATPSNVSSPLVVPLAAQPYSGDLSPRRSWKKGARLHGHLLTTDVSSRDVLSGSKRVVVEELEEQCSVGKRLRLVEEELDDSNTSAVVAFRELERVARKLWFDCCFGVDCDQSGRGHGRRGGLGLLWKNDLAVAVQSFSQNHIDAFIGDVDRWRFTGFFGNPEEGRNGLSWSLLARLACLSALPWLCAGDYNEILFGYEKSGGNLRLEARMVDFRDCIENCGLVDLGFRGHPFTWSNKQAGGDNIRERLDRVLCNSLWSDRFPEARVSHLTRVLSDHCPLVVEWEGIPRTCLQGPTSLEDYGDALRVWDDGNLPTQIKAYRAELDHLQHLPQQVEQVQLARSTENKLAALLRKEDVYWLQRSRVSWMKDGDSNTKFFHKISSGRRKRNLIMGVRDSGGVMRSEHVEMERVFMEYFSELFTAKGSLDMDGGIRGC
ncbi:hypothetical protein ACS0TY_030923 [Phlomoides rotata]